MRKYGLEFLSFFELAFYFTRFSLLGFPGSSRGALTGASYPSYCISQALSFLNDCMCVCLRHLAETCVERAVLVTTDG